MNLAELTRRVAALEEIMQMRFPRTVMAQKAAMVETVQNIVADELGVKREHILSEDRRQKWAWPRHVAMKLAHEVSGLGTPSLAPLFNRLDHTTLLRAMQRVEFEERMTNAKTQEVRRIRERVNKALNV